MSKKLEKLPGVASLRRANVISDGVFFSINRNGTEQKIPVIRHGIRGTQNTPSPKKGDNREVSNIQITESAKTDMESTSFGVDFGIKFLPLSESLSSCAGEGSEVFRNHFQRFTSACKGSEGVQEVGRRFARNILNGRWLWRNRTLSDDIQVTVESPDFIVSDYPITNSSLLSFEDYTDAEKSLGDVIAQNLTGEAMTPLKVRAVANLGFTGSVEVYPSQNYVQDKPSGFARPLYKLGDPGPVNNNSQDFKDVRKMGVAALRDQKIGNAIRTIDTWYPDAELNDHLPIAVEPEGANLGAMKFFRTKKSETTSFELAKKLGEIDPDSSDGMFMIAAIARGGVYSQKND